MKTFQIFFAPEHGGETVKSGPAKDHAPVTGEEEIADALGQTFPGRGRVPGTADPGVPGSRTNPVNADRLPEPKSDKPVGPLSGEGSGAGS